MITVIHARYGKLYAAAATRQRLYLWNLLMSRRLSCSLHGWCQSVGLQSHFTAISLHRHIHVYYDIASISDTRDLPLNLCLCPPLKKIPRQKLWLVACLHYIPEAWQGRNRRGDEGSPQYQFNRSINLSLYVAKIAIAISKSTKPNIELSPFLQGCILSSLLLGSVARAISGLRWKK